MDGHATLREWIVRLRATLSRTRDDRDLEEELRAHRELAAEDAQRRESSSAAAVRAARIRAGSVSQAMESVRDQRGLPWLDELARDLRHAVRMLWRSPAFTAVAVLTLALAVGANTAVFSLLNAILWQPLPVESGRDLVRVLHSEDGRWSEMGLADVTYYREHATVFSGLSAYSHIYVASSDARELDGYVVSGNFFSVLGVKPALGRFFIPSEDEAPLRDPVVVLGYDFWRRRFNNDPTITGRSMRLNGTVFTIIGVAPERFRVPNYGETPGEVWIPSMMMAAVDRAQTTPFTIIARLKPGHTLDKARAELAVLGAALNETSGHAHRPRHTDVVSLTGVTGITGVTGENPAEFARIPRLLMLGVISLLVIACANLAGLLLARGLVRAKEIAVRLSLGASKARVARQLLTENILLAVLGAAPGILFAHVFMVVLRDQYSAEVEGNAQYIEISLDPVVLTYSVALAVVAGILFGTLPALQAIRPDFAPALRTMGSERGYRRSRLRAGLLISQVALSLVLLVDAGLVVQSLRTVSANAGFDAEHVAFLRMKTNVPGYSGA